MVAKRVGLTLRSGASAGSADGGSSDCRADGQSGQCFGCSAGPSEGPSLSDRASLARHRSVTSAAESTKASIQSTTAPAIPSGGRATVTVSVALGQVESSPVIRARRPPPTPGSNQARMTRTPVRSPAAAPRRDHAPAASPNRHSNVKPATSASSCSDGSSPSSSCRSVAEAPVLAERLVAVSLREVHANEGPVGALAQRLDRHRRQPRLDRLAEPPRLAEPAHNALEGMRAQLAETLALDRHPVVVPVGKHVAEEAGRRAGSGIRRSDGIEQAVGLVAPPRRDRRAMSVGEPKAPRRSPRPAAGGGSGARAPSEAAGRALVGRVEPERAGHVGAVEAWPAQREEGEDALTVQRQQQRVPVDRQSERSEQPEPAPCARPSRWRRS